MIRVWYRIALADAAGPRLVVAPGEHLGVAIDLAKARAGRGATWPIAAQPASAGEVPLGDSVGKGVVVERDPPAALPTFRWPDGVLPTLEGARALATIAEGYTRRRHETTEVVEATVTGDRLVDVFLGIVERLPAADNVEVRVTGRLDDAGVTEVWLTPRLDVRRAIRFLDDHDVELLGNGHVEVAVYLRKQRSTLRLTDHKTIAWLTEDPTLADTFVDWLALPPRGGPGIADVDHYHWRPAASRARPKLLDHLRRARLRKVDAWEDRP